MSAERFPNTPERKAHNALKRLRSSLEISQKPLAAILENHYLDLEAITPVNKLVDLKSVISTEISNISSAAEVINSSVDRVRGAVEPLIAPLELEIKKQIILNDKEKKAIEEALDTGIGIQEFFSDTDTKDASREYLTRVMQLTIYYIDHYGECEKYSIDALFISDQLINLLSEKGINVDDELLERLAVKTTKIPLGKALFDQVEIFETHLRKYLPEEFDEYEEGEEDEEKIILEEIKAIDDSLWTLVEDSNTREALLEMWEELLDNDKRYIVNDPSGYQACPIIVRALGLPMNETTQELAKLFSQAVQGADLDDYRIEIPVASSEDSKK